MSLPPWVRWTNTQNTKRVTLMANHVMITLLNINDFHRGKAHFELEQQKPGISELSCSDNNPVVSLVIFLLIHMIRERGKPCRGTTWYAFDARWRRQQRFEWAFSMARTKLVHKDKNPKTPLMAYVEDIFSEEPIQAPSEHLLFTVPDNWNTPTWFPGEATIKSTGTPHSFYKEADQMKEPTTCFIEEEILKARDSKATTSKGEFSKDAYYKNAQREPQGRNETGDKEDIKLRDALLEDIWVS